MEQKERRVRDGRKRPDELRALPAVADALVPELEDSGHYCCYCCCWCCYCFECRRWLQHCRKRENRSGPLGSVAADDEVAPPDCWPPSTSVGIEIETKAISDCHRHCSGEESVH